MKKTPTPGTLIKSKKTGNVYLFLCVDKGPKHLWAAFGVVGQWVNEINYFQPFEYSIFKGSRQ